MVTVVTGASGFVGAVLVRELLSRGEEVRAVDLHRGPALSDLDVAWSFGDVLDPASLDSAFAGADLIYHLAAMISISGDPTGQVWRVNVDGVRHAAEAARRAGARRFVHCSSVHAYDLEAGRELDEAGRRAVAPHLPAYDRSKAAGEAALRGVIEAGLDAVVVNPTGVIGPMDYAPSRTGALFLALFRGRLPALIAGAFDWVDVRDVAGALISAASTGKTGENYLVPGHLRSVRDLAAAATEVSGTPPPWLTVPMWAARLWGPIGDVVTRRSGNPLWYTSESLHALRFPPALSGDKARAELDHQPRPFVTTVSDIYEWFQRPIDPGEGSR